MVLRRRRPLRTRPVVPAPAPDSTCEWPDGCGAWKARGLDYCYPHARSLGLVLEPARRRPAPLARCTRVRAVNPGRRRRLHERNFGDKAKWVRGLHCLGCGRMGVVPAHARCRGMGGCGGSSEDLVPLCPRCHGHQEEHSLKAGGVVVWTTPWGTEVDLTAAAAALEEEWQERQVS